jgi:hypothetical protein
MSFDYGSDDVQQSKFDSGWFKVLRLQQNWDYIRRYWRQGKDTEVNHEMDIIWFELEADAKDKQRDEIQDINKKLVEARKIKDYQLKRQAIFKVLGEKWTFLARVEKTQGLGKRYVDPTEDELD